MVDATRSEAALCNLKSTPFSKHEIADRNSNILKQYLHVPVRSIVIAKNADGPHYRDAGSVPWHQDH